MEKIQKNSVILVLLAIVLVMAIGYAAFAQQLTINGSAEITSKWDVHISDISVNQETLNGKNLQATVGEDNISATFKAELVQPGSAVTYNVTVKNGGTLNAKLDTIVFNDSNNEAIQYSYAGINEDDVIEAAGEKTFTVTVKFNESLTQTPSNTTSDLTMTLSFVQA